MEKAEQAKKALLEKEIREAKDKKKKILIIGIVGAVVALLIVIMLSSTIKCNQYEKKLAGHTYRADTSLTVSFPKMEHVMGDKQVLQLWTLLANTL